MQSAIGFISFCMGNLHGKGGRICINGPDKMTKMASQPINCKNLMGLDNK